MWRGLWALWHVINTFVNYWNFKLWEFLTFHEHDVPYTNHSNHMHFITMSTIPKVINKESFQNNSVLKWVSVLKSPRHGKRLWFTRGLNRYICWGYEGTLHGSWEDCRELLKRNNKLLNSCPQTSFGLLGNLYCYTPRREPSRSGWGRLQRCGRG